MQTRVGIATELVVVGDLIGQVCSGEIETPVVGKKALADIAKQPPPPRACQ
jgi:hypothetical protein